MQTAQFQFQFNFSCPANSEEIVKQFGQRYYSYFDQNQLQLLNLLFKRDAVISINNQHFVGFNNFANFLIQNGTYHLVHQNLNLIYQEVGSHLMISVTGDLISNHICCNKFTEMILLEKDGDSYQIRNMILQMM